MLTRTLKLILALIFFINAHDRAFSQNFRENPIIFLDAYIGQAVGNAGGFSMGLGINYQVNKSFFTARALGTVKFGDGNYGSYNSALLFSIENSMGEVAVLYGLRTIENGHAYSFSLGASYNEFFDETGGYQYFGVPFEANFKWFKKEKKRLGLFGVIPIGEPTGFGESFGFKLFGNFSKQPYAGIGLSVGLGYHKVYD